MLQKAQEDQVAVCLQEHGFLCFGEYVLYKGNGETYHVNSVEPIEVFYNVRTDLDKLQYAAHIAKIAEDVTNENDTSYNILQLILNTIYTISETNLDKELVLAIFKLRLLSLIRFFANCYRMRKLWLQRKFNSL